MSASGTKLTYRSDKATSAFERKADVKCSTRAFPLMTLSGLASDVVGARFRCTPLRPGVGHGSVGESLSEKVRRVAPPLHNV
jgi:hypothetical protein